MSDEVEKAITEDAPPGAGYLDLNSGEWLSAPPPPIGSEVAARLDEHAARMRQQRERQAWLREQGW